MFIPATKGFVGVGWIALNIVRVLNIFVLLSIPVVSVLMITFSVKEGVRIAFIFGSIFRMLISVYIAVSEMELFKRHFQAFWPLFSDAHGFLALGLAIVMLSISILGDLESNVSNGDVVGKSVDQFSQATGYIGIVAGVLNLILGFIWTITKVKTEMGTERADPYYTARMVRRGGASAVFPQVVTREQTSQQPGSDVEGQYGGNEYSPRMASTRTGTDGYPGESLRNGPPTEGENQSIMRQSMGYFGWKGKGKDLTDADSVHQAEYPPVSPVAPTLSPRAPGRIDGESAFQDPQSAGPATRFQGRY